MHSSFSLSWFMHQKLYLHCLSRIILIMMVIIVCSTAGQSGTPGSTSSTPSATFKSPPGTGGLSPPDVDSTDSYAEAPPTTSFSSVALSCFMYMFLEVWWCMDDLVRVLDSVEHCHVAFASSCNKHCNNFVSGLVGGSGCNLPFKWKARVPVSWILSTYHDSFFFLEVLILFVIAVNFFLPISVLKVD